MESTPDQDSDRRERREHRNLIDLTRAERGEPERRHLPGVERRDDVADVPDAEKLPDADQPDAGVTGDDA